MGLPPTGKRITMVECGFLRFREGQLVELWRVAGEVSLLRQLGILPPMPTS
jgi:predicted ester cyclase